MKKIAIFASGSGSNYQAIIDSVKAGVLETSVELLVCDNLNAFVLERAKQENTPSFAFDPKEYRSKADFEKQIAAEIKNRDIDLIVLAGYMRLIGPVLLQEFPNRIINIHPSFLPAFPGKDAIGQAVKAGAKMTGVTIHYVDEGMDTGPIIAQETLPILEIDTEDTLAKKIHEIEHRLYPEMIQVLLQQISAKIRR